MRLLTRISVQYWNLSSQKLDEYNLLWLVHKSSVVEVVVRMQQIWMTMWWLLMMLSSIHNTTVFWYISRNGDPIGLEGIWCPASKGNPRKSDRWVHFHLRCLQIGNHSALDWVIIVVCILFWWLVMTYTRISNSCVMTSRDAKSEAWKIISSYHHRWRIQSTFSTPPVA